MRALAVAPGQPRSACLLDVPEPSLEMGSVLVQTIAIGICGTDVEIVSGRYGWPPPGRERLVIGHESIGRVLEAPEGSNLSRGDLIVGGSERFRVEPEFAAKIDATLGDLGVLLEPASVVAKAWDHAERIGARSSAWSPRSVLVTGAGPIGLLAALMGRQRGLEVHVFDQVVDGPKLQLAQDLGARYYGADLPAVGELDPDIIIECTGATRVIADVITRSAPSGIVCLTGVSSGGHAISLDLGGVNRSRVLENDVVFGSVNANRAHYEAGAVALARADRAWLSALITRRVPLADWQDALDRRPHDVKVIVEFDAHA